MSHLHVPVPSPTTSPDRLQPPAVQLDGAPLADLELVLGGVRLPWSLLGGRCSDGVESASDDRTIGIRVDQDTASAAWDVGALLVVDREGTPVARFTAVSVAEQGRHHAQVVLRGWPRRAGPREASRTAGRPVTPEELGPPAARRTVVVAGRPPLSRELTRFARDAAGPTGQPIELVVIVPAEQTTPDGLDPVRLLRCTDVATAAEVPGAVVLPVPVWWRDEASDDALVRALGEAYGAERTVLLGEHEDWRRLVSAARARQPLPSVADAGVLSVLDDWGSSRSRRGVVVMLTGLSGSGKSTIAKDLTHRITATTDRTVSLLDGDDVRRLLSSELGFDRASRDLNVRRIAFVAAEVARHGGIAICAPIAPYRESRAAARAMADVAGDFVLVHVSTPLEECERRDVKGLYARARGGHLDQFTGISDPYEEPDDADVVVDTTATPRELALQRVMDHLVRRGLLPEKVWP